MPELRHNPVNRQWVIIATERGRRPHDFEPVETNEIPRYCPFCRGHEEKLPYPIRVLDQYGQPATQENWQVRVVPNRYPALQIEGEPERAAHGIYDRMNGIGAHEVIIDSPEHNQHIPDMSLDHLTLVLDTYRERIEDLLRDKRLRHVLVFKNFGKHAGASLSHPHSQIIATSITPIRVVSLLRSVREHFKVKERCLFCDIIAQEIDEGDRIVALNNEFVAFCPYASRFPFEINIIPRKHAFDYSRTSKETLRSLAEILSRVLKLYRVALDNPPYNLLLHTAPNISSDPNRGGSHWETLQHDFHWHIEIFPRTTHMAGFEWGTGFFINPTPPETAAQFLREIKLDSIQDQHG